MFSLKKLFGKDVKVTMEETVPKEPPMEWYEEIKGKRGFIYPQSLDKDIVCVQTTPILGKKMLTLFGNRASFKRRGDTEFEFTIPLDLVRSTFRYLKPRKIRHLSPAQKAACIARLESFLTPRSEHNSRPGGANAR